MWWYKISLTITESASESDILVLEHKPPDEFSDHPVGAFPHIEYFGDELGVGIMGPTCPWRHAVTVISSNVFDLVAFSETWVTTQSCHYKAMLFHKWRSFNNCKHFFSFQEFHIKHWGATCQGMGHPGLCICRKYLARSSRHLTFITRRQEEWGFVPFVATRSFFFLNMRFKFVRPSIAQCLIIVTSCQDWDIFSVAILLSLPSIRTTPPTTKQWCLSLVLHFKMHYRAFIPWDVCIWFLHSMLC